jgi:DNA-binding PadR family transcriptional regulator
MFPFAILGCLAHRPSHGYDLKTAIEDALGGQREINFGQIYTTLSRLERDKLAIASETDDGRGKKIYSITPKGRKRLEEWLAQTVEKAQPYQDEFLGKLIVRRLAGYGDTKEIIKRQRQVYLQQLRDLNATTAQSDNPFVSLLIEGTILRLEADSRWLDLCEERLGTLE